MTRSGAQRNVAENSRRGDPLWSYLNRQAQGPALQGIRRNLFRAQVSVPELHLFVRRRRPDEIGAISVDVHGIPQRHGRSVIQNYFVRVPQKLFTLLDVESELLCFEDLVELRIAVAQGSPGHAGSEILLEQRVRIRKAAPAGQIDRIFAVLVVGIEDAPLRRFEICLDAYLGKLLDDYLGYFAILWVSPGRAVIVDLESARKSRFGQQLFRFFRIVRKSFRTGVVAEDLRTQEAAQRICIAFENVLDDPVAVDGVGDGTANFYIIQRFVGRAQHEKNRPQSLHLLDS